MYLQYQQPSELLAHFRQIPSNQHFAIIRFFEQNTPVLGNLPIQDYIILLSYYVDALYEEGGFDVQVLANTEELLELSIIHNVQYIDGQDIYLRTLLQRAVALIHLGRISEATHLSKQLFRLAPENKTCRQLLHDCLLMQRPTWVQQSWATAILLILVAMLFSFTEILLPQSWHEVAASTLNNLSLGGFLSAIMMLSIGLIGHYYYVWLQIRRSSIIEKS